MIAEKCYCYGESIVSSKHKGIDFFLNNTRCLLLIVKCNALLNHLYLKSDTDLFLMSFFYGSETFEKTDEEWPAPVFVDVLSAEC